MSRKKWQTLSLPAFIQRSHQSQKAAYEYVRSQAVRRAAGSSRITTVVVKVKEGDGPWQTFERVNLDEIASQDARGRARDARTGHGGAERPGRTGSAASEAREAL